MNYRRHGLRALGLSLLAALGLMAFMAAGASADKGEWLILDSPGGTNLEVNELHKNPLQLELAEIVGRQVGVGRLLILKLNLLLKCEDVLVVSAHIIPLGKADGKVLFDKCYYTTVAGLVKNTVCDVEHFTADVKALIIAHNGNRYLLFSPLDGTLKFALVKHTLPECTLPEVVEVKGHVIATLPASGLHAKTHTITSIKDPTNNLYLLELFPNHTLAYGAHVGHLEATAEVELAGEHTGLHWGYHSEI